MTAPDGGRPNNAQPTELCELLPARRRPRFYRRRERWQLQLTQSEGRQAVWGCHPGRHLEPLNESSHPVPLNESRHPVPLNESSHPVPLNESSHPVPLNKTGPGETPGARSLTPLTAPSP